MSMPVGSCNFLNKQIFFLKFSSQISDGNSKEIFIMEIPTYQIHKVMRVYTKQLTQSKLLERNKSSGGKPRSIR